MKTIPDIFRYKHVNSHKNVTRDINFSAVNLRLKWSFQNKGSKKTCLTYVIF